MARHVLIPRQTVTLFAVAFQSQLGLALAVWVGLGRMLRVIEDEHVTGGRLGGDNALVLGHVSCSVDFALVINANLDFDFSRDRAEAAELGTFAIVV